MVELFRLLMLLLILAFFVGSQIYWVRQIGRAITWLVKNPRWRSRVTLAGALLYLMFFAYNAFRLIEMQPGGSPTSLSWHAALLEAPFRWWVLGAAMGFAVAVTFKVFERLADVGVWTYRKLFAQGANRSGQAAEEGASLLPELADPPPADLPMPGRRRFLEQVATVASAAPFVASAYGLLHGRLDLDISRQRVPLARLPRGFDGFRIAQLSDIHIGPYMSEEQIRKFVSVTNDLKPDVVVLTGDFITWDPATEKPVVAALSHLRSPYGIFGCLGNHETWTETEDSITQLFAQTGIRILRTAQAAIAQGSDRLNFLGVDYQTRRRMGPPGDRTVRQYLEGVEGLLIPGTVNILLSHNPNTFDRAAELGIDLSLAGHTHGGQLSLEFVHPSLSPSRLVTRYLRGWYQKDGARLYVNRGIGTIGFPMRLAAAPEITLYELTRQT